MRTIHKICYPNHCPAAVQAGRGDRGEGGSESGQKCWIIEEVSIDCRFNASPQAFSLVTFLYEHKKVTPIDYKAFYKDLHVQNQNITMLYISNCVLNWSTASACSNCEATKNDLQASCPEVLFYLRSFTSMGVSMGLPNRSTNR